MSSGSVINSDAVDRIEDMKGARSFGGRGAMISVTIVDFDRKTGYPPSVPFMFPGIRTVAVCACVLPFPMPVIVVGLLLSR